MMNLARSSSNAEAVRGMFRI